MPGFDSFLTSLTNSLNTLMSGEDIGDLTRKAKASWNAQTPMTQGAIAGGLLAILFSGSGRKLVSAGAEIGGAALIAGLALQAWRDWQAEAEATARASGDDLSMRLARAMVAAASAGGAISVLSRVVLKVQIAQLGLGPDPESVIAAALEGPLDALAIAALARTPEEAAGIYTASLLVVNRNGAAEQAYLAGLAIGLGLDAELVRHLEANVPAQG